MVLRSELIWVTLKDNGEHWGEKHSCSRTEHTCILELPSQNIKAKGEVYVFWVHDIAGRKGEDEEGKDDSEVGGNDVGLNDGKEGEDD